MKKIIYGLFLIFLSNNTLWSQESFNVGSSGVVRTLPGSMIFVGGDLSVSGDLTTESDATSSGSLIVTGTSTGDVAYKRYVGSAGTSVVGTDWHLVSAPVIENKTVEAFVTDASNAVRQNSSNGNYALSYYKNTNDSGKRWTYHNTSGGTDQNKENIANFISGLGYSMNRTSAGEYNFSGEVPSADVVVTLPTTGTHLWSSIGNPYPSFLPVNDNANVSNLLGENISKLDPNFAALYFWNGSDYEPILKTDGEKELAPGQAFLVNAVSGAASQTFTFSKDLQTHKVAEDGFYKSNNTSWPTIVVRLSNGTKTKRTRIEYLETATIGLDTGFDVGAYQDGTPTFSLDTQLVSENKGIDFTRQFLPISTLKKDVAIPLSVRAAANEEITFSADAIDIPTENDVYLEDVLKNTYTKLTDASYKIKLETSAKGVGRFYLHTSSKTLGVEDAVLETNLHIYKTTENTLKITGLVAQGNATVEMYSVTGAKVLAKEFVAKNVNEIAIPKELATGVYVVTVVSGKGKSSKKIVIE